MEREGYSVRKSSAVHVIRGYEIGTVIAVCGIRMKYNRTFELYTDEEIEQNRRRICINCNYIEFKEQGKL